MFANSSVVDSGCDSDTERGCHAYPAGKKADGDAVDQLINFQFWEKKGFVDDRSGESKECSNNEQAA